MNFGLSLKPGLDTWLFAFLRFAVFLCYTVIIPQKGILVNKQKGIIDMPNEQIHLRTYVSPEVRKKLKVIAVQKDLTIAELLRKAVEMYLKQEGIEIDMSEGMDTHGGYRGGPKDKQNNQDDE